MSPCESMSTCTAIWAPEEQEQVHCKMLSGYVHYVPVLDIMDITEKNLFWAQAHGVQKYLRTTHLIPQWAKPV